MVKGLTLHLQPISHRSSLSHMILHLHLHYHSIHNRRGWSGGTMVLGKLPVPGRPTVWIIVGQGPTALAGGAGGGCLDIFFSRLSFLFSYSLSLGDGQI